MNMMGIDYLNYLCTLLLKRSNIHKHVDSAEFALSDVNWLDIMNCLDLKPKRYSYSEMISAIMDTEVFKKLKK